MFNDNVFEKYEVDDGKELRISFDTDPMDPREHCDQLGHMLCFHNRYSLGDSHADIESIILDKIDEDEVDFVGLSPEHFTGWEELENLLWDHVDVVEMLPINIHDHSGISLSTGMFGSMWDSGRVGLIFVTKDDLEKYGTPDMPAEQIKRILEAEVEEYSMYVSGEVFGFELIKHEKCPHCNHVHNEVIDSGYGFKGFQWEQNGLYDAAGVTEDQLTRVYPE